MLLGGGRFRKYIFSSKIKNFFHQGADTRKNVIAEKDRRIVPKEKRERERKRSGEWYKTVIIEEMVKKKKRLPLTRD